MRPPVRAEGCTGVRPPKFRPRPSGRARRTAILPGDADSWKIAAIWNALSTPDPDRQIRTPMNRTPPVRVRTEAFWLLRPADWRRVEERYGQVVNPNFA